MTAELHMYIWLFIMWSVVMIFAGMLIALVSIVVGHDQGENE